MSQVRLLNQNEAESSNGYDEVLKQEKKETNKNVPAASSSNSSEDNLEYISTHNHQTPMSTYNEERIRKKLQFFFMNPIEKWQAGRRFPHKFVVQVVKIFLITMQICLFAHSRYNHVNYTGDNKITFCHLFLKGWDPELEVEAYPPATGALAIYEKLDFFKTIDYAVNGYKNLNRSIGPYSYPSRDNKMVPLKLCLYTYKEGIIYGFNESYVFNPEIEQRCISLTGNVTKIGSKEFLLSKNIDINFAALVKATLDFSVKTVNFKPYGPLTAPDCYRFDIKITFDNQDHDGQMLLDLDTDAIRLHCRGDMEYITDTEIDTLLRSILNIFVILICFLSFALCTRAIYRAQVLRIQVANFFKVTHNKELSLQDKWEFINMWYIMIILNDVLLIIGSALKEQIERQYFVTDGWNICSLFLGIGNLLVWFGVLRYLGFFRTYNVVMLTLKTAAPKMMRFLICALLIYAGFTFCGWLVLGPYHAKFRSLSMTSECLFSLINGDDMFATFSTMSKKSLVLLWFSKIYLYIFTSLFIYIILSLFISVIMDAYDTIKRYYREGFPQSDLKRFAGQMNYDEFESGIFQNDLDNINNDDNKLNIIKKIFCCCCTNIHKETPGPTGYTSLNIKNRNE